MFTDLMHKLKLYKKLIEMVLLYILQKKTTYSIEYM